MGAMHAGQKISRRDFVKTSVVAGGALLASTVMPGQAMNLPPQGQEGNPKFTNDGLVKGVCDIHLHLRPDSRERSADEYGFMQDAMRAGYRAVMFKSNDFSCHDRAYLIRQAQPEAECFGSFCMNRVHGDRVNPFAAQKAVETSGGLCRCIWMPTLDAAYHYQCEGRKDKGIPVLDDNGQVLPEVVRVMEICAEAGIIFATGHIDCTGCYQCIPCPKNVAIGYIFAYVYNNYLLHRNKERAMADYTVSMSPVQRGDPASSCVGCGECLAKCPQHLDIPSLLARVKDVMGK